MGSRSSQYSETFMRQNSCKTGQKVQSSVFCRKLVVTAMHVIVSGKLFQADAAGKARSPMVAGTVRGATILGTSIACRQNNKVLLIACLWAILGK